LFYSSVAGVTVAGAAVSVAAGAAVSVLLFGRRSCFSVASVSLSEPLSESPSTIAAVTKDKIFRLI
jgi:hypothetical protein